ncbi:hypothetical protein SYNPS1DRAFT_28157 [Syncephalis pseudoplumigaleata]|uniref:FTP domain-containing protein n=1 Tax=Syncephalis pseudoplumigaleata TaxID=1712513 RepID=A0A4P9Z137_9FUNG|nr:hypothetical protein SYNPS1DRAFT_28157 [Syncephalis pseudoplumigaleata]|eukprot:RKP26134.1 hypothetical protein SYNPS1DRAFT_28157 [Syncephalis pseudoplumigaleata]
MLSVRLTLLVTLALTACSVVDAHPMKWMSSSSSKSNRMPKSESMDAGILPQTKSWEKPLSAVNIAATQGSKPELVREFNEEHPAHDWGTDDATKHNLAIAFLKEKCNIPKDELVLSNSHASNSMGMYNAYFYQEIGGVKVVNGDAHVNINKVGHVRAFSDSFYKTTKNDHFIWMRLFAEGKVAPSEAFVRLLKSIKVPVNKPDRIIATLAADPNTKQTYYTLTETGNPQFKEAIVEQRFIVDAGKLVPIWEIRAKPNGRAFTAWVKVEVGKLPIGYTKDVYFIDHGKGMKKSQSAYH